VTTTTSPTSTAIAVAVAEPVFTHNERLALAGFPAGYAGLTREAYALDLRQFTAWCHQRHIGLFQARRADIECFARDLEARGRACATSRYRQARDRRSPSDPTRSRAANRHVGLISLPPTKCGWLGAEHARSLCGPGAAKLTGLGLDVVLCGRTPAASAGGIRHGMPAPGRPGVSGAGATGLAAAVPGAGCASP
jgi:hypothetical protein